MDKTDIANEYFHWIAESLATENIFDEPDPVRVLKLLHDIPFEVRNRLDANRVDDGENLRYRFGSVRDYSDALIAATIDNRPCSVLEVLAAMSLRAGEQVFGHPIIKEGAVWIFWEMLCNLGIMSNQSAPRIRRAIQIFLGRSYCEDGYQSPFYLPGCEIDMRSIELWNQMMGYISYHYDDFVEDMKKRS